MRHFTIKKLISACTALAMSSQAVAGMDTLVQFANLSPFSASIEFPAGDSRCWYDDAASYSNVSAYFGHYLNGRVSHSAYSDYLGAFKEAYGVKNLDDVPRSAMKGTYTLKPAVAGAKVPLAQFIGETDAHIELNPFSESSCKNRESNRAFNIVLRDGNGNQLGKHRYLLQDPPDGAWKLSRSQPGNPSKHVQTLRLGSGGQGNPIEIGVTAGVVVLTVATLGYGAIQYQAARIAARKMAESATFMSSILSETGGTVVKVGARHFFHYALTRGLSFSAGATVGDYVSVVASGPLARVLYAGLVGGTVIFTQTKTTGSAKPIPLPDGTDSDMFRVPDGQTIDPSDLNIDFSNPAVAANSALPDERSICVYQTGTLGITECRLVGIQLTIMPNGSLMFAPLPSVGGGK
ncbi:MAG: hypothetical protein WBA83_14085 [Burkholderiaceae bacterium]